jgi:VWFA-related protein
VISAANRANVAIYTIDSAGLRPKVAKSKLPPSSTRLPPQRMRQQSRGTTVGSMDLIPKSLERNEDLLRFDPRSGLGQLADQTGGFLIHDTNDLSNGLRRISDDMHGYYMMTYIPKNQDYNGQFRRINVKLSRSNLELQTRKGLLRDSSRRVNFRYLITEAPAIAAARNANQDANPFPFHGAALSLPRAQPARADVDSC